METTILHLGFYETSGNNFTFSMTLNQSFYPCYNRTTNINLIIAWFNVMPSIESHYRVIHLDACFLILSIVGGFTSPSFSTSCKSSYPSFQLSYYDDRPQVLLEPRGSIDLSEVMSVMLLKAVQGAPKRTNDNSFFEV